MPDLLAIVSKAVFEAQSPDAAVGATLPLDRYTSNNPGLRALAEGGRLFLVTVRPPDEQLWLVAVLDNPKHDGKSWVAKKNVTAVKDVSSARGKVRFVSDTGMSLKKGALGMSLQTPRALTEADVGVLLGGKQRAAPAPAPAPASKKTAAPARASGDVGAALKKKDFAGALELARAEWESTRSPALAEVVTTLGAQLPEGTGAWTAQLKKGNLAATLATLTTGVRFDESLSRIKAVVALQPDPRISGRLIDFLLAPPFTAQSSREFWKILFDALTDKHADPRAITLLEPQVSRYLQIFGGTVMGNSIKGRIEVLLKTLRARKFTMDAEVPASLAALLPKIEAKKPAAKSAVDELISAVFADPEADGPREVLADALLEKNDPRGEFMSLQLRKHRGETLTAQELKQEAALQKKNAKAWSGALADITYVDQNRFERGFVTWCRLRLLGGKVNAVMNHPAWNTVRSITISFGGTKEHGATLLVQPALKHLRELYEAPYDVVTALAEKAMDHELELLNIGYLPVDDDGGEDVLYPASWDPLIVTKAMPKLKELQLTTDHVNAKSLTSFWSSPLAKRLERFQVEGQYSVDARVLVDASKLAPPKLTVRVVTDGLMFEIKRGSSTATLTKPDPSYEIRVAQLEYTFKNFPKELTLKPVGIPDDVVKLMKKKSVKLS